MQNIFLCGAHSLTKLAGNTTLLTTWVTTQSMLTTESTNVLVYIQTLLLLPNINV